MVNNTGNIPEVKDWPRPLCCDCKNRRNLQVCRDSKKSGRQYLVTVNCGYFNLTETSTWKYGLFTDYENEPNQICSIIAWAEKPETYKEET